MRVRCLLLLGGLGLLIAMAAVLWWRCGGGTQADAQAETNRVARAVEVKLANRTLAAAGFPERFCQHQTASARGTAPYVVALADGASKIEAIKAVRACGARVVGPLPPNALLVETSVFALGKMSVDGHFAAASEWLPEDKIDARLKPLLEQDGGAIDVTVVALISEDVAPLVALAASQGGDRVKGCLNGKSSVVLKLPRKLVSALAKRGDVRWLEPFVRPKLLNDVAVEPVTMNVRTVWDACDLSGNGQLVTTSDSGIDTGDLSTMHADLRNRVAGIRVVDGCFDYDADGHGTHTAGSIVGDGSLSGGQIRGAAFGAKLWAWFCCGENDYIYTPDDYDELFRPDGAADACIHSASWGVDTAGAYDAMCRDMDEYVWEHPDFLPVIANGNAGTKGARTVGSPAAAKNVLAVGATQNARTDGDGGYGNGDPTVIASYSSRGPCADGRIKPDLASPGTGILSTRAYGCSYKYGVHSNTNYAYSSGTSMATPLTAGAAALVREWLTEKRGFTNAPPTAALVKAVLTGGAKGVTVPDSNFGWGRTDLGESLYPSNRCVRLVDRVPFGARSERVYTVTLTNAAPLDVQLVWIDYPATAGASAALVNDLDLSVSNRTTGAVWFGNGTTDGDRANTVESVRLAEAAPGEYDVVVRGRDVSYDSTSGGAAALYLRGAFDSETNFVDEAYVPTVHEVFVDARTGDDKTATGATNAPYATISAALAQAVAGDVLRVAPGSYEGGLAAPSVCVRIESTDGPSVTFLDGGGTNWCYDGSASMETVLSGFTLTNGWIDASYGNQYGAGAYYGTLTNCTIVDCHIVVSRTYPGPGGPRQGNGFGGGAAFATLLDCRVEDCSVTGYGGGIYDCFAASCTLIGNSAGSYGGGAAYSDLSRCTVFGNIAGGAGGGVDCECTCVDSIVWGNSLDSGSEDNWELYVKYDRWGWPRGTVAPAFAYCCTTPTGYDDGGNNIEQDPLFVSTNELIDVRLFDSSPCLGRGSDGANIGAYAGTGVEKVLPAIDVATATGEEVSNAVASVGYVDKSVERGIGTNGATYAAFQAWSTNGLKSTAVVFSARAFDSFLVRELVAAPTLLGDGNETTVELTALEPATDGTCSTTLRLVDGEAEIPLCSVKAAYAAKMRVGTEPNALAAADAENVSVESTDGGRAVKLTIVPPLPTARYFMRFVIP